MGTSFCGGGGFGAPVLDGDVLRDGWVGFEFGFAGESGLFAALKGG
jgi:hypothetical protein